MRHKKVMEPPWNIFDYPQSSMGWRMGGGEDYLLKWEEWFELLSQQEQQAYIAQYPEPQNWFAFYCLRLAQNEGEYDAIIERLSELRKAYCDHHYELAVLHESTKSFEKAIVHLTHAISFNIGGYRVWDVPKITEAFVRYEVLKRQLIQQMALNPATRDSWKAMEDRSDRLRIAFTRTMSSEEYEYIQQGILVPSVLGQTWTKYFENQSLYIHRHWREPCLFWVIFQQEDQAYCVAEAWMSPDPTIPRPFTRPPREPALLLDSLIRSICRVDEEHPYTEYRH